MRQFELRDYRNSFYLVPLDIDKIDEIMITVVSGDEIADILYLDGTSDQIDVCEFSQDPRLVNYYDGNYIVYSVRRGIDRLDEFDKREDTYSMFGVINNDEE